MWQNPKTDWTANDFFNASDFNRIVGNVAYLKSLADKIFKSYESEEMAAEKNYTSMIYAREINAIVNNLEKLNINSYSEAIGTLKKYQAGGNTPTYEDYNQIENACLRLYNHLICDYNALNRFEFTLNTKGLRP